MSITEAGLVVVLPDESTHYASPHDVRWTLCVRYVGNDVWHMAEHSVVTCEKCLDFRHKVYGTNPDPEIGA